MILLLILLKARSKEYEQDQDQEQELTYDVLPRTKKNALRFQTPRDDPHSQLLKGSNTYFAATLITHVIPAPKITPAFSKSSG
jgi:hypothetical protein